MKNVLLLGASGTLGKALAARLYQDTDLHLTLFSRKASETFVYKRSRIIDGDATKAEDLQTVMADQDIIVCMVSGDQLLLVAGNVLARMKEAGKQRLIFTGAIGVYNEIPDEMDGKDNVANNPDQIPNRDAVVLVEESGLDYTILRPGFIREGDADGLVLSFKGEAAKGYITTLASLVDVMENLVNDDQLYVQESVSVTKDMR